MTVPPTNPPRLLVVEDSPFSKKLIQRALESEPYELLFADDGKEALRLISECRPDIVIMDWMLPDSSGPELCRKIRSESTTTYVYIVLLTSNADKEHIVEGLEAGADDYVAKPFHNRELLARINSGRRIVEMHREIEEKNHLLEQAACTDFLTDLPNRRAVVDYAQKQIKGAQRHGFSVWVMLADLNKFKFVNDHYGHAAGDEVLKRFALILKKRTRLSDICGRLGGDEFIVVVTHIDATNVITFAERLKGEFLASSFEFDGESVSPGITIGIGGSEGSETGDFEHLLARADAALYAGKADGIIHVITTDRIPVQSE